MKRLFVPGVFDVFHIGHLNYLRNASRHGDYLIVGVQDDRAVFQVKGVKPVIPLAERMAIIEELRFVNEVVSYTAVFQGPLLSGLNIQVLAVGEEYGHDDRYPDQKTTLSFCKDQKIEVIRIPRTTHVSSTNIRARLKEFWSSRAKLKDSLPAGVTVLGSFKGDQSKVANETQREIDLILTRVDSPAQKRLLDLGCGDGRHLAQLCAKFGHVTGVDYSSSLLEIAAQRIATSGGKANLVEADVAEFRSEEPFDVLLLSGIIQYLDDEQLLQMLRGLQSMSHPNTALLVRTPIGLPTRIDVMNQYSQELNARYTAYYRTIPELESAFLGTGWKIQHKEPLYQHRPDTAIWWFEFQTTGRNDVNADTTQNNLEGVEATLKMRSATKGSSK